MTDQQDTVIVPLPAAPAPGAVAPPRSPWRQPVVWVAVVAALVGGLAAGALLTAGGADAGPAAVAGATQPGATADGDTPADGPADGDTPADGDFTEGLRQLIAGELGDQVRERVPGDVGQALGDLVEDPAVGEQVQRLLADLVAGGAQD